MNTYREYPKEKINNYIVWVTGLSRYPGVNIEGLLKLTEETGKMCAQQSRWSDWETFCIWAKTTEDIKTFGSRVDAFATNPENKITHHVIYEVSDILIGGRKK